MPGTRSLASKIIILVICCSIAILIQQYIVQLNGSSVRSVLTDVKWTYHHERRSLSTSRTTTMQTECSARRENAVKVLNLTSLEEGLNQTDYQILNLKPGGRYTTLTCEARHRVAVIVPYRDRETHLEIFLKYMHPFLQRQQIDYGIFVIESIAGVKFNRALLLNIGFVEVKNAFDYDCFIFHDVDLLPESDVTDYTCDKSPLHMASAIDTKKYRLPYRTYFGGVCAFKKDHFEAINGFSNLYFDWGGEDDDIHERIKYSHMKITHLSPENGRYKMLKHEKAKQNPDNFSFLSNLSSDPYNCITKTGPRVIQKAQCFIITVVQVDATATSA